MRYLLVLVLLAGCTVRHPVIGDAIATADIFGICAPDSQSDGSTLVWDCGSAAMRNISDLDFYDQGND